ncbi:MAG: 50S ribosomal protein L30 [Candidatus Marinimicrobia bacterium]|nr:50S ribosomal protein L30 [Candidatus Neomarinimicrobiota bacterium]MCH7762998.1 50S ribosomal protein L30 [Candidatus Neomarinimicrobiota bacterium]
MAKAKTKSIRITQVRSRIGRLPKHKATLDALGLRKINQTVELPDNQMIRGMIKSICFLIKVEEA